MVMMHAVMAMPATMAALAIAMHMPMLTCRGTLHLWPDARPRRRLAASQLLRAALDFGHPRRIGAFTDAALGRLRKRGGSAQQQRQHCD
jgi:hypothetical protein